MKFISLILLYFVVYPVWANYPFKNSRRVYVDNGPELILPKNTKTVVLYEDLPWRWDGLSIAYGSNKIFDLEKNIFVTELSVNCEGDDGGDVLDVYANGIYINSFSVQEKRFTVNATINARVSNLEIVARVGHITIEKVYIRTRGGYGSSPSSGSSYLLGDMANEVIDLIWEMKDYVGNDDYRMILNPIKVKAGLLLAESNSSGDSAKDTIEVAKKLVSFVELNQQNLDKISEIETVYGLIQELRVVVGEIKKSID